MILVRILVWWQCFLSAYTIFYWLPFPTGLIFFLIRPSSLPLDGCFFHGCHIRSKKLDNLLRQFFLFFHFFHLNMATCVLRIFKASALICINSSKNESWFEEIPDLSLALVSRRCLDFPEIFIVWLLHISLASVSVYVIRSKNNLIRLENSHCIWCLIKRLLCCILSFTKAKPAIFRTFRELTYLLIAITIGMSLRSFHL